MLPWLIGAPVPVMQPGYGQPLFGQAGSVKQELQFPAAPMAPPPNPAVRQIQRQTVEQPKSKKKVSSQLRLGIIFWFDNLKTYFECKDITYTYFYR